MIKTNARKTTYGGITFRSGLEAKVAKILNNLKIKWSYESIKLDYEQRVTHKKLRCDKCGGGDITVMRQYTPDFILKSPKRVLEVKGRFSMSDRKKMLSVIKNNPKVRVVIILQQPNAKISKKSKKTYGSWCTENNIEWVGFDNLIKYL
tara:strand:- start:61386 stop:61832 length:447 start_codon:yes stop_codon:yes gene_type:complete